MNYNPQSAIQKKRVPTWCHLIYIHGVTLVYIHGVTLIYIHGGTLIESCSTIDKTANIVLLRLHTWEPCNPVTKFKKNHSKQSSPPPPKFKNLRLTNALNKFMVWGWATFIALLGCMWLVLHRVDKPESVQKVLYRFYESSVAVCRKILNIQGFQCMQAGILQLPMAVKDSFIV